MQMSKLVELITETTCRDFRQVRAEIEGWVRR